MKTNYRYPYEVDLKGIFGHEDFWTQNRIRKDAETWCYVNCEGDWSTDGWFRFWFEKSKEALIFKLSQWD